MSGREGWGGEWSGKGPFESKYVKKTGERVHQASIFRRNISLSPSANCSLSWSRFCHHTLDPWGFPPFVRMQSFCEICRSVITDDYVDGAMD